jgi:hypothetical protein
VSNKENPDFRVFFVSLDEAAHSVWRFLASQYFHDCLNNRNVIDRCTYSLYMHILRSEEEVLANPQTRRLNFGGLRKKEI